jgi:hypothetical protein
VIENVLYPFALPWKYLPVFYERDQNQKDFFMSFSNAYSERKFCNIKPLLLLDFFYIELQLTLFIPLFKSGKTFFNILLNSDNSKPIVFNVFARKLGNQIFKFPDEDNAVSTIETKWILNTSKLF